MAVVKECCRLRLLPFMCAYIILVTLWITDLNQPMKGLQAAHLVARIRQPFVKTSFRVNDEHQPTEPITIHGLSRTTNAETNETHNYNEYSESSFEYQLNMTKDENERFLHDQEMVYNIRRHRVEDVCKQLGRNVTYDRIGEANLGRLRWLNSRKLIMCFNAKVGTSSWSMYLLNAVRPRIKSGKRYLHNTAQKILRPPYGRYSAKSLQLMKEFGTIIIVRHPFARIVSAYLDKIAGRKIPKVADHIIKHYRSPSSSSSNSTIPTFEEFVKYLLHKVSSKDDIRSKAKGINIHWAPYYSNCAPCNIHYDVILNMETIDQDTRYVNQKFHLGLKENLKMNHLAPKSSEQSALRYFQTLPLDFIVGLYQRYRIDFMMFGYSISPYLRKS